MHRSRLVFPLVTIFLFAALAAEGQIASSPFSEYGIGDLVSQGMTQNQAMGGIGISNPSPWYLNTLNPALLTFNKVVVFQGGMQFEKKTLSNGPNNQSFQNGNLNYLAVAFPVKLNRWTTSLGLTPYSNVDYNLGYQDFASGSYQVVNYQQNGKGGLNQFYWSNGVSINKYLSVGVKASYLFGSIVTQASSYNAVATGNAAVYQRDAFHGANLSGGISLHFDSLFGRNYRLNLGGIGSLGADLSAQHIKRLQSVSTRGTIIDSLTISNEGGKMSLPWTAGGGISFGKVDRWTFGVDYNYLDFSKFEYKTNDGTRQFIGNPTNGYRTGFGFEITPRAEDFTNYFNRVAYRVGGVYERSTMLVNGRPLIDLGVTFGASFPVSHISTIDLGIKVGRRGSISDNMLQEDYFRIYFGVTFNDRWFIKRKFD